MRSFFAVLALAMISCAAQQKSVTSPTGLPSVDPTKLAPGPYVGPDAEHEHVILLIAPLRTASGAALNIVCVGADRPLPDVDYVAVLLWSKAPLTPAVTLTADGRPVALSSFEVVPRKSGDDVTVLKGQLPRRAALELARAELVEGTAGGVPFDFGLDDKDRWRTFLRALGERPPAAFRDFDRVANLTRAQAMIDLADAAGNKGGARLILLAGQPGRVRSITSGFSVMLQIPHTVDGAAPLTLIADGADLPLGPTEGRHRDNVHIYSADVAGRTLLPLLKAQQVGFRLAGETFVVPPADVPSIVDFFRLVVQP